MKRRLRRGGRVAWRQVARTVVSATPTSAATWLTAMPVRARSRICCFFVASIGRQAMLRIPRAVVVALASAVGATLAVLSSGATSPAMRRLRKASRGFQLFVSSLLKRRTGTNNKHRSIFAFFSHVCLHYTPVIGLGTGVRVVNSLINS